MAQTESIDKMPPEAVRVGLHESLLGSSTLIQEVNDVIQRLAPSNLTVLITGESGTGKDIAARLLHRLSPRYGKPFIKVNCPAIPETILESELFGYERGAFTGARTSKPGRFELANHGTIFLDEVAETSLNVQSKLLQVLDGESFMRIGGVTPVHTDVRILAATNMPLDGAVQQGKLREDIFFRLTEVVVEMPPLRDRPEDIPLLAEHFNFNYRRKLGKEYEQLPRESLDIMCDQPWRGNVRELAARVKKYVVTGDPEWLLVEDDEATVRQPAAPVDNRPVVAAPSPAKQEERRKFVSLKEATRVAIEKTERALIEEALKHTLWNRRKAAKLLDISYSSLLRRIDAYNIGKNELE